MLDVVSIHSSFDLSRIPTLQTFKVSIYSNIHVM
jgi:hypothetical protein